jgi:hypothetical protein
MVSFWINEKGCEHPERSPWGGVKFIRNLLIDEGGNQPWLGVSKPDHKLPCLRSVTRSERSTYAGNVAKTSVANWHRFQVPKFE